ncbi:MAG: signal peptidase I [Clostridia bacterium]|nr:signal peptidase I [Clostridia bacterium]
MTAWLPETAAALALALFLRLFVVNLARIKGTSMLPTLHSGEWTLVWRLPLLFRPPHRGDVVICHYPGRRMKHCRLLPQAFVKRVIGLPGDTVEWIEGVVHINGEALAEKYLDPARCRIARTRPPRVLGADEYYVLGDHRDRSNDSRSIGPIRRRDLRGHVVCVMWPIRAWRRVR